jgi:sodium-dependent phosphate cotransporter
MAISLTLRRFFQRHYSIQLLLRIIALIVVLFAFLLSLELMSGSCKLMGKDLVSNFLTATSNPFIGLFIGLLATAIIQSSSTTTSMIVAVVASGTLSLANAVPMIIGANIGTTITSTIVAFGHITRKKEFRRAIGAATVHDFFNIFVTIIIFPLEYYTHFLTKLSANVAQLLLGGEGEVFPNFFVFLDVTIRPLAGIITKWFAGLPVPLLLLSIAGLFASIQGLSSLLQKLVIKGSQRHIESYVFGSPYQSALWGTGLTALLQSSSVTTAVTVPLVATKRLSLSQVFPFVIGANVGTTFTALLASVNRTDTALSIAIAHFLFNLIGAAILLPSPFLRNIPVHCAQLLGAATLKNRLWGFFYLLLTFFLVPFLLIFITTD